MLRAKLEMLHLALKLCFKSTHYVLLLKQSRICVDNSWYPIIYLFTEECYILENDPSFTGLTNCVHHWVKDGNEWEVWRREEPVRHRKARETLPSHADNVVHVALNWPLKNRANQMCSSVRDAPIFKPLHRWGALIRHFVVLSQKACWHGGDKPV